MNPVQIIASKRDGAELSGQQIRSFIQGYSANEIPDYQMAALAMAIYLNGMTDREIAVLTECMLDSGTRLTWPDDGITRVDKHSTGGVGDKTSLILAPLLAAAGLQVPMLSGRGLGPTGGTLDKLESIPGFRTDLSLDELQSITQQVGCVITGASAELAPADRRLYALRDVTATVPSIPLITASIMSKKLAESLDSLVLDVKFGSGAFMKTEGDARDLADSLVKTGQRMGVKTSALLTDMNQPLGRMCGNTLEVMESIDVLKGAGPDDVRQLMVELAIELLVAGGRCDSREEAQNLCIRLLDSGAAYEKFEQMVTAQGGRLVELIAPAPSVPVVSQQEGFVRSIDTEGLGLIIIDMNGGRRKIGDEVDHSTGIEMLVRVGDRVEVGQPMANVFNENPDKHLNDVRQSISIGDHVESPLLIVDRVAG